MALTVYFCIENTQAIKGEKSDNLILKTFPHSLKQLLRAQNGKKTLSVITYERELWL